MLLISMALSDPSVLKLADGLTGDSEFRVTSPSTSTLAVSSSELSAVFTVGVGLCECDLQGRVANSMYRICMYLQQFSTCI